MSYKFLLSMNLLDVSAGNITDADNNIRRSFRQIISERKIFCRGVGVELFYSKCCRKVMITEEEIAKHIGQCYTIAEDIAEITSTSFFKQIEVANEDLKSLWSDCILSYTISVMILTLPGKFRVKLFGFFKRDRELSEIIYKRLCDRLSSRYNEFIVNRTFKYYDLQIKKQWSTHAFTFDIIDVLFDTDKNITESEYNFSSRLLQEHGLHYTLLSIMSVSLQTRVLEMWSLYYKEFYNT